MWHKECPALIANGHCLFDRRIYNNAPQCVWLKVGFICTCNTWYKDMVRDLFLISPSHRCAARSWSCWDRMKSTTTSGKWPSSARTASTGSSLRSRRPKHSRASLTSTTQVCRPFTPAQLLNHLAAGESRIELRCRPQHCLFRSRSKKWFSPALSFCVDAFDNDLIITTLWDIKEGKTVHIPVYDFVSHSRWMSPIMSV